MKIDGGDLGPVRRSSTIRFHAWAAFLSVSLNNSFLESMVLLSLRKTYTYRERIDVSEFYGERNLTDCNVNQLSWWIQWAVLSWGHQGKDGHVNVSPFSIIVRGKEKHDRYNLTVAFLKKKKNLENGDVLELLRIEMERSIQFESEGQGSLHMWLVFELIKNSVVSQHHEVGWPWQGGKQ